MLKAEKRYTKASNLSGGQKRKLSIALALVGKSSIIFLDEPTSGLDPVSRDEILDILEEKSSASSKDEDTNRKKKKITKVRKSIKHIIIKRSKNYQLSQSILVRFLFQRSNKGNNYQNIFNKKISKKSFYI